MAVPMYEVLERTFIEPHLLEKGSVIRFEGAPGPHLFALNEEAQARFELWYNEEYPLLDKEGEPQFVLDGDGKRVVKMYKPHAVFRRRDFVPVEKETFELVSEPPVQTMEDVTHTLAGLGLKQSSKDIRPGPDRIYRDVPAPAAVEAPEKAPPGGLVIEKLVGTKDVKTRDLVSELQLQGASAADRGRVGAEREKAAGAASETK